MCDYLLHYFSGNRGWNDWQLLALPTPPFWIVYAMFLLFRSPEISVFFLSSWWWLLILLTLVWNPSGPANQVKKYSLSEQSLRFFPQSGFAVSNVNTKGIESFSFPCVPLWLPPPPSGPSTQLASSPLSGSLFPSRTALRAARLSPRPLHSSRGTWPSSALCGKGTAEGRFGSQLPTAQGWRQEGRAGRSGRHFPFPSAHRRFRSAAGRAVGAGAQRWTATRYRRGKNSRMRATHPPLPRDACACGILCVCVCVLAVWAGQRARWRHAAARTT